jgi:hypothetical protein
MHGAYCRYRMAREHEEDNWPWMFLAGDKEEEMGKRLNGHGFSK